PSAIPSRNRLRQAGETRVRPGYRGGFARSERWQRRTTAGFTSGPSEAVGTGACPPTPSECDSPANRANTSGTIVVRGYLQPERGREVSDHRRISSEGRAHRSQERFGSNRDGGRDSSGYASIEGTQDRA